MKTLRISASLFKMFRKHKCLGPGQIVQTDENARCHVFQFVNLQVDDADIATEVQP